MSHQTVVLYETMMAEEYDLDEEGSVRNFVRKLVTKQIVDDSDSADCIGFIIRYQQCIMKLTHFELDVKDYRRDFESLQQHLSNVCM